VWQGRIVQRAAWIHPSTSLGSWTVLEGIVRTSSSELDDAEARRVAAEFFEDVRTRGAVEAVRSRGGEVTIGWP